MRRTVPQPLRFDRGYFDREYEGIVLLCPSCGDGFTHQREVEVWNRPEDVERDGTTVDANGAIRSISADRNPSDRRQGIRVWFECEISSCQSRFAVTIAQHKGQTLAGFEREPDDTESTVSRAPGVTWQPTAPSKPRVTRRGARTGSELKHKVR